MVPVHVRLQHDHHRDRTLGLGQLERLAQPGLVGTVAGSGLGGVPVDPALRVQHRLARSVQHRVVVVAARHVQDDVGHLAPSEALDLGVARGLLDPQLVLALAVRRREVGPADDRQPAVRVVPAVAGAVAVGPLVVAHGVHRRLLVDVPVRRLVGGVERVRALLGPALGVAVEQRERRSEGVDLVDDVRVLGPAPVAVGHVAVQRDAVDPGVVAHGVAVVVRRGADRDEGGAGEQGAGETGERAGHQDLRGRGTGPTEPAGAGRRADERPATLW